MDNEKPYEMNRFNISTRNCVKGPNFRCGDFRNGVRLRRMYTVFFRVEKRREDSSTFLDRRRCGKFSASLRRFKGMGILHRDGTFFCQHS
jgi:hypothetical protein